MKKIASSLPLQDMIRSVIFNAQEKLAAEEEGKDKKVRSLLAYEKKEHGHIPTPSEEEAEKRASASITDPDYVEKLAAACDYIASNADRIESPQVGVLQAALQKLSSGAAEGGGSEVGPGKGPGHLEVSMAIGGTQSHKKDHPKGHDAAASEQGAPMSTGGLPGGHTQLENNVHVAPGQSSGEVPHAKYPHLGPMTSKMAGMGDKLLTMAAQHPTAAAAGLGGAVGGVAGAAGGAAGAAPGHRMGGALKGGLTGGALGAAASGAGMHHAMKTAAQIAREHILSKLAGEDVMKAHIDGGGTTSPLLGKGQLESAASGTALPRQAGDHKGGHGNEARSHIASNRAAIDATKKDAKGPVKKQLAEVLDEPALNSGTDSVLERNLRNTGKAGVKIAADAEALQKIANGGCQCEGNGECSYCQLKVKTAAIRAQSKTANMGGSQMGGGYSGGGGGMGAMAEAGQGPDGCTCGHTGECRVCKLKAAMAAAGAPNGGGMGHEKDSMGATGGVY